MVKILKIIVTIGIYVYSCANYIPDRVKNNFTYCYNSDINYSQQSLLKFNGFYKKTINYNFSTIDNNGVILKTTNHNGFSYMIFYSDGIYTESFFYSDNVFFDNSFIKRNYSKLVNNIEPNLPAFEYWGIYKLAGDTLKTISTNHKNWPTPYWELSEKWYVVKKDSLKMIFYYSPTHERCLKQDEKITIEFIETNTHLSSDTWLKGQKWFWCNENAWGKYMDSVNTRKKNGKK